VAISPQQDAKVIEPGDDALKFHTVHQENGERNFGFAYVVEKGVL
jgi:hypothetical protein